MLATLKAHLQAIWWIVAGVETVTTIYGLRPLDGLRKREGGVDNDHEHTTWLEYYLGTELVHRSVHVRLKKGQEYNISQGAFSG